jgi:hypothetical protein
MKNPISGNIFEVGDVTINLLQVIVGLQIAGLSLPVGILLIMLFT